jgi:AcrR family transcriptional regulator
MVVVLLCARPLGLVWGSPNKLLGSPPTVNGVIVDGYNKVRRVTGAAPITPMPPTAPKSERTKAPRTHAAKAPLGPPAKSPAKESFRRLAPAERRAQIIAVAAGMFGTRPYAELSVHEVALAAGVTDNLVYHYFPNREALFLAAFEQKASELLASCLPPADLPVFAQLERAVRGYLDFVEENATTYLNLFRGALQTEAALQRIADDTRTRIAERYLFALGIGAAHIPLTRLALAGYIGFVEATVLRWLPVRPVPRALLEQLIFSATGNTLLTALELDGALPGGLTAAAFRAAYGAYFGLT